MNENLKDILSNLNTAVDQATLLKYLEGKLSAEEQHQVEKNAIDDAFEADALEGLQGMNDKRKIAILVEQLNQELHNKTKKKKHWPHHRQAKVEPSIWIAVVLILLLAVVSYFIVSKLLAR